jgi:uncharacterized protein YjeT (DUF2065 family)
MASLGDQISKVAGGASNFLLLGYPMRTGLGVMLGLFLATLAKLFAPILSKSAIITLGTLDDWHFAVVGVVLMHIPTFVYYLKAKPTMFGENEEKAFEVIRRAQRAGLTETQVRRMYLDLCGKVLANVQLKQSTQEELREQAGTTK